MKPIDVVLRVVGNFKRQVDGFVAPCPAHEDRRPSLRIAEGEDGRVLMKCRAGCPLPKVLQALGLTLKDLFVHDHRGDLPPVRRQRNHDIADPPPPDVKWKILAKACFDRAIANPAPVKWLALKLGVSIESLVALRCGTIKAPELASFGNKRTDAGFTFPERDGRGRIVGVSIRWPDGEKGFVHGGNRGLTIPAGFHALPGLALVVEGQSDTAALYTMGLASVGRPSNTGGADALARLLRRRETVIIGEEDRKPGYETRRHWTDVPMTDVAGIVRRLQEYAASHANGRAINWTPLDKKIAMSWPGLEGAVSVASKLTEFWKRPVYWAMPPAGSKDVRAYLNRFGEEADLLSAVFFNVVEHSDAVATLNRLRKDKLSMPRYRRKTP